jgi:hypothetical protein
LEGIGAIDAVRILMPGIILGHGALVAVASALSVVVVKWAAMRQFEPVIKPLRSVYVWWNEVVNCAYETIAAPALAPPLGTPSSTCVYGFSAAR